MLKGKIYKIVDNGYNDMYIGSTTKSLSQRMAQHRYNYKSQQNNITVYKIFDKYGVENAIQNKDIKDKLRSTFLKKYGVEHALQNKKCKDKMIQTNLKRYGVEHSQQNQEIQEKTQRNAKKYKPYKMPSGALRKVQGYEPFALNELIKSYTEEQIKTDRKDVPRIEYILDNKKHYYFPDIYISHENYIIEIKSIWTYKKELDKNDKKAEACKKEGYKFEFWVYDCKGNKQII